MTEEMATTTEDSSVNTTEKEKNKFTPKKIKTIVIVAILAIVVLYLFSPAFLRHQLQFGTWHYVFNDGDLSETEIKFRSDGTCTWYDGWEILDDKTLVIITGDSIWGYEKTYYDYGEWYCTGFKLVIDDDEFVRFAN